MFLLFGSSKSIAFIQRSHRLNLVTGLVEAPSPLRLIFDGFSFLGPSCAIFHMAATSTEAKRQGYAGPVCDAYTLPPLPTHSSEAALQNLIVHGQHAQKPHKGPGLRCYLACHGRMPLDSRSNCSGGPLARSVHHSDGLAGLHLLTLAVFRHDRSATATAYLPMVSEWANVCPQNTHASGCRARRRPLGQRRED